MRQFTKWRKINVPSCIHFVTTNTLDHHPFFLDFRCCDILLKNLNIYRQELGFKIFGYSIMPDHVHFLIWFEVDEENELDEQDKLASTLSCENNLRREKFSILSNGVGSGLPRTSTHQSPMQDEPASITDMESVAHSSTQQNKLSAESSLNISKILHRIKGKTAVDIKKELQIDFKWQKNFYDFNIYTRKKYLEKLNYIHNNQYKDTRILNPDYYPYSSIIFLETGNGALKIDEIDL